MLLIKNGYIVDPQTKIEGNYDILIKDGIIAKIEKNIDNLEADEVIDAKNLIVSPGLFDIHVHFRDLKQSYKETIETGTKCAISGGFTTVVCMANTDPVADNKKTVEELLNMAKKQPIDVLVCACVTKGMEGKELVDFEEMIKIGVVGFSDDGKPITNANVLEKALIESKKHNVPVSLHEEDPNLILHNGINKFSPVIAEESMIGRDIMVAIRTLGKMHIQHLSSENSVNIIRTAKKEFNSNITCEATPHHFSLIDETVDEIGVMGKMNPPLRSETDRLTVIKGLQDGTIDIIATDHAPHSKEEKEVELLNAPSGIIGLETSLSLGIMNLVDKKYLTIMQLIEKMSINPAKLYSIENGLKVGNPADICIFDAEEEYIYNKTNSKSTNSPFFGKKLKGKVKKTIKNGIIVYDDRKVEEK